MRRWTVVLPGLLLVGCSASSAGSPPTGADVQSASPTVVASPTDVEGAPAAEDEVGPAAATEPLGTCPDPGDPQLPDDVLAGEDVEVGRTPVGAPLFWLEVHDEGVVATDFETGVHHIVDGQVSTVPHELDDAGLVLRLDDRLWLTDLHGGQHERLVTLDLETGGVLDERPVTFDFPYFWGERIMGGTVDATTIAWIDMASGATFEVALEGQHRAVLPVGGHLMTLLQDSAGEHHFAAIDAATAEVVAVGSPDERLAGGYVAPLGEDCLVLASPVTVDSPTTITLVEVPGGVVADTFEIPMMSDFYNLLTVGDTVWASGFAAGRPRMLRVDLATGTVAPPIEWPRAGQPHMAVDSEHAWFTHGKELVAVPVTYGDGAA